MQGLCVHFLPCLCSISTAFPLAPAPTDIQLGPINGEKAGLKINIKKTKNMASIPTTLWQIDGEKWKQWWILFSWAPKSLQTVTAAMKLRHLLLGRKLWQTQTSILKSRDITLLTKVRIIKAVIFPVVMYGGESWTMKKAETEELMLLNCGVGEDSWEFLGLQGDPTSPS